MKLADVKLNICIDFNKENNTEGPKSKVGDNVRKSKYTNIFANGYVPNWSGEAFEIKKVKNTVISDLNREEIVGMFYLKESQCFLRRRV